MRDDAAYEDALLRAAIDSYAKGYRANPGHYYSGINALTLMHLYRHLTGDARYDQEMATMAGAVRFAAECEPDERQLFWAKATLGDLEVLVGTPDTVTAAYKEAIARNEKDWFALNSSRAQLQLLKDLGFRPDTVEAGIATFDRALREAAEARRTLAAAAGDPVQRPHDRRAGSPDAALPRRQGSRSRRRRSREALEQLGAGPEDLALCQAAAGGDLLFLEACQQRGVRCQILLPFPEPEFIERSILPSTGGDKWRERFFTSEGAIEGPHADHARRARPAAQGRRSLRALQSLAALHHARVRRGQGAVRLPVERRRRRRAGRDRAHVQRGEAEDGPGDVDRHADRLVSPGCQEALSTFRRMSLMVSGQNIHAALR